MNRLLRLFLTAAPFLVSHHHSAYNREQILEMERNMLGVLDFNLTFPSIMDFMKVRCAMVIPCMCLALTNSLQPPDHLSYM